MQCTVENYVLHAPTIRKVVCTAYSMFRLFFGHFTALFNQNIEELKGRLEYFFSRYLPLLRLHKV